MKNFRKTVKKLAMESTATKSFQLICFTVVLIVLMSLSSCKKNDDIQPQIIQKAIDSTWMNYPLDTMPAEQNQLIASYPTTSYTSVPAVGSYQAAPTSSIISGGVTYYGGPFQSCVGTISGSTITFNLKRNDGYSFPVGSVLKIKSGSAGGTVLASVTLSGTATVYSMSITESTQWNASGGGVSNPNNAHSYTATWYNPQSGLTFYTKGINIIAVPTGWGIYLTQLNAVNVYSNGYGGFSSTNLTTDTWGQKYQCVHYIKRYYATVYGKSIGSGNADVYWYSNSSHNLPQKILNGSGIPQQGDVICFSSTTGSYHVGIVAGVVSGKLRVFQENVGQTLGLFLPGNYCSGYKDMPYTITASGYNVNPTTTLGSSWTTLGWVR